MIGWRLWSAVNDALTTRTRSDLGATVKPSLTVQLEQIHAPSTEDSSVLGKPPQELS